MDSQHGKVREFRRGNPGAALREPAVAGMAVERRPFLARVRDAAHGLWDAYREEPNLRFHVFAAAAAFALAWAVELSGLPLLYLLGAVLLVLIAETVNTAVERAVDLASQGRLHPLARQAKDAAAGAVLLAVAHATVAGYMLFVAPRGFAGLLRAVAAAAERAPAMALAAGALVAAAGFLGLAAGRQRL